MKIKVLRPCHVAHVKRESGESVEVADDTGAALIAAGYAMQSVEVAEVAATSGGTETADAPPQTRGRKSFR